MRTHILYPQKHLPFFAALFVAFLLTVSSPAAFADNSNGGGFQSGGYANNTGGYSGPGPALVTVEQAKSMQDDALVALKGHIIRSLGDEDYVFKDATGTITVEIDQKRWQGQNVGPDDLVILHGEVDKEWAKVEIDVKRVIKQ